MIDSHVHLDDRRFSKDRDEVIRSLEASGVQRVYNIGDSIESSRASVELANKYKNVFATVGIHPHNAKDYDDKTEKELIKLSENKNVRAIGEIGLDYYYDNSPRDIQRRVFKRQIDLAARLDLPIVIHSRDAAKETLDYVKYARTTYPTMRILIHCFSQSVEMLHEYLKQDCYIALGGTITYKNSRTPKEAAKECRMDRLVLETDCPYLTPEPYRGKRNEPKYVSYVAEMIADVRGMTVEEVIEKTSENTLRFYGDL